MSRELRFPNCSSATPGQPAPGLGQKAPRQWEQMVAELLASGDDRPPDPGKPDEVELAIARYLSADCSGEERAEIERLIAKSPELSECVALGRQAIKKTEAA